MTETETCTLTATYRGRQYIGTGTPAMDNSPFDEAVAAIAFALPNGEYDDIIELDNAGCKAGTLRWDGEAWDYHPIGGRDRFFEAASGRHRARARSPMRARSCAEPERCAELPRAAPFPVEAARLKPAAPPLRAAAGVFG